MTNTMIQDMLFSMQSMPTPSAKTVSAQEEEFGEVFQKQVCRFIGIPAGNGVEKEKLQCLMVCKAL